MTILNNYLIKILQIFVYLFPLSFIFGNGSINLFVIIISLSGLLYYKTDIFKWHNKYLLLVISIFFLLIFFNSYYHHLFIENSKDAIKSILYFRYLLLLLVIRALILNNDININRFLKICFIISLLISFDIIFQFIMGKNILGNSPEGFLEGWKHFSGMFGSELIAGGFILMFASIGIFSIFDFFTTKKKIIYLLIFFTSAIIFLFSLILAGNRMPLILFIIFLSVFSLIYKKKEKIYFIFLAFLAFILTTIIIINSESLYKRATNFYVGIPNPFILFEEIQKKYPKLKKYENSGKQFHTLEELNSTENYRELPFFTGHIAIYITSIDLFLDKPLLGRGIKSYRNNCYKKVHLPNRVCTNHPHNYVLEILNDTGLIGLITIFYFVIYLIFNNYKDYLADISSKTKISNWVYLAIILSLFIHFFPFKSTGSFFSTFNSSFIFLILGISLGLYELKYKKYSN